MYVDLVWGGIPAWTIVLLYFSMSEVIFSKFWVQWNVPLYEKINTTLVSPFKNVILGIEQLWLTFSDIL